MILKINQTKPDNSKVEKAVACLKQGGIIIYPTDTIYGLGCDIFQSSAISKIYQIKKRDRKKPLSILCSSLEQISEYAQMDDLAFRLLKKALPGPYTFILKARNKTPQSFIANNKTVGVRIPDNKICQALVKQLGNPIITTSLNLSGDEPLIDPNQLDKEMSNKIDLILDSGPLTNLASTVIDLSQGAPEIVRLGQGDVAFLNL